MMLGAAVWGLMMGCAPAGRGPSTAPKPLGGLRYYLARDFVVVEADVTEFVETRIEAGADGWLKPVTESGIFAVKASVGLETSADPSRPYMLDAALGGAADQSLAVRVGNNGLLTSAEFAAKDKSAEILVQIARLVGAAAGTAAGFRGGLNAGTKKMDASGAGARRRLESLSLENRYYLQESSLGRELWEEANRFENELAGRKEALRRVRDEAVETTEPARYSLAEKRAAFLEGSIRFLEKQTEAARAAFASAAVKFSAAEGIGRTTRERKVRRHLDITDLPPSAALTGVFDEAGITDALEKAYPRVLDLYRETGIAAAFDPDPARPEIPDRPAADPSPPGKNEIRIFYREPVPGFLRIYSWREAVDREAGRFRPVFVRLDEKLVFAVHPQTPVLCAGFERKAFSSRNMQLTVNAQGRVVGLSKSAASIPVAAAAGTAAAFEEIRESAAASLKEIRDIMDALRKLSLGELETQAALLKLRLDKLKKEAEIEKFEDDGPPPGE